MRKVRTYTDEFKTKIVLEILREERSLSEISSEYEIAPSTLSGWKEQFLRNAYMAFSPDKSCKKLKDKLKEAKNKEDDLYKQIGMLSAQVEWAKKKSEEYGLGF